MEGSNDTQMIIEVSVLGAGEMAQWLGCLVTSQTQGREILAGLEAFTVTLVFL